ncbi:acetamidase/formamidase family protein [Thermaerobacter sp. FW80]|uniref:acetamidase/formamidase family protein n=1 Tax=Thermaerobacter sp. FW80 TaxID=2546351 RepID=UPI001074D3CE|nr:acetamidase/formamidase family protein [Thermaerobacter sp. FW80]QBS37583.1 acetamidase/formamidase family protein [Thermaerobacter sp. FW80]
MALPLRTADETVFVDRFTDGVLDPAQPMLGPVRDGGHIVANTAPGCWGPMITPHLKGGHEVTVPVAVEGAEVGDAVAIRIKDITVTSIATASGNDRPMEGRFVDDPYCAARCPQCGTMYPPTRLEGIGPESVRCANCGADATPFTFTNGYTIVFDATRRVGVTVHREAAEAIARDAARYAALPARSTQNPILRFAPHDLVGVVARLRPFLGQLGTVPAIRMPDSHNAGDFGAFLIGKQHEFALTPEQLALRTDGHMDCDAVRAGAIVIAPVKVPGAGVYLGDMHALQGDGEIAGHTCDVSGTVTLQVEVIKGLNIDGPILFPVPEDLPYLARPFTEEELARARALAEQWGLRELERTAPISVIGTGPDLNAATDNGLERAARLLDMTVPEVKNRATITGAIEIARHPGVVQVTFLAPVDRLARIGLGPYIEAQYGIKA